MAKDSVVSEAIDAVAQAMNSWDGLEFAQKVYGDTEENLKGNETRMDYINSKHKSFRTNFGYWWGSLDYGNRARFSSAILDIVEDCGAPPEPAYCEGDMEGVCGTCSADQQKNCPNRQ